MKLKIEDIRSGEDVLKVALSIIPKSYAYSFWTDTACEILIGVLLYMMKNGMLTEHILKELIIDRDIESLATTLTEIDGTSAAVQYLEHACDAITKGIHDILTDCVRKYLDHPG